MSFPGATVNLNAAEVHVFLPYPPQAWRTHYSLSCSNPLYPCRLILCLAFPKINMPPLPLVLWRISFHASDHSCCCPLGALQLSLIRGACRKCLHISCCWSPQSSQVFHCRAVARSMSSVFHPKPFFLSSCLVPHLFLFNRDKPALFLHHIRFLTGKEVGQWNPWCDPLLY